MHLLITGGCGFLGSNLAAEAIRRGMTVTLFDNLSRVGSSENLAWLRTQGRVKFVHGDIRCQSDIDPVVGSGQPEMIFHVAGQVAMTTSLENPRRDFEINALGTLNVLESVRRHVPKCLIAYSSTNKVYGDLEQFTYSEEARRWVCNERPNGFGEDTSLNFASPYGCSKGSADQYLLDWHKMYGLKTVVFRHSSMYGGRQFSTVDQGWVGWFVSQALAQQKNSGHEITISGDGKQVRDVLHANDMVSLYFRAAEKSDQVVGQAFNIGGGIANSLSLLELFDQLGGILGHTIRFRRQPPRASDQRVFVADLTKVKQALGWSPKIDVAEGLRSMHEWVRQA